MALNMKEEERKEGIRLKRISPKDILAKSMVLSRNLQYIYVRRAALLSEEV